MLFKIALKERRNQLRKISELTRRDIIDIITDGFELEEATIYITPWAKKDKSANTRLHLNFYGRLNPIDFLNRIYPLSQMPSTDSRFDNAQDDIYKHRVVNDDWGGEGWVFNDNRFSLSNGNEDEPFLNFLCEMFHPCVRVKSDEWKLFLEEINRLLKIDGYELFEDRHISGRPLYKWKCTDNQNPLIDAQIKQIKDSSFNSEYIQKQIDLMTSLISTAPDSAIGKAKELLESCAKTILDERGIEYKHDIDFTQLLKRANESIGLDAKSHKGPSKPPETQIVAKVLGGLSAIADGMDGLRNYYGDGHGKAKDFKSLPERYARFAVGVSVAAVQFMWDTYTYCNKK